MEDQTDAAVPCDRQGAGRCQTQDLESESVASLGTGLGGCGLSQNDSKCR